MAADTVGNGPDEGEETTEKDDGKGKTKKKKKKGKDKKKKKKAKADKEANQLKEYSMGLDNQSEETGFGQVAETEATEKTAVSEGDTGDSPLSKDDGRTEMLYDLYGVVHHQGALSGGHYVASLKSDTDGQWRLFNDAQIFEIHSRDVVDSSAYILFYIRRDVKDMKLSDFWDTRQREGGITEEEMDKLIRGGRYSKVCSLM